MNLLIKNMVSFRCKLIVKSELENQGLHYTQLELGEVQIVEDLSPSKRQQLKIALQKYGFELMEDKQRLLIEKIKSRIFEFTHAEELPNIKFSELLGNELHRNYPYLSMLFSEVTGISIEHYIIIHKIERVKEFIIENKFVLSEIAFKLNYSSSGHLSNQFRQITGLTPSFFKKMMQQRIQIN